MFGTPMEIVENRRSPLEDCADCKRMLAGKLQEAVWIDGELSLGITWNYAS